MSMPALAKASIAEHSLGTWTCNPELAILISKGLSLAASCVSATKYSRWRRASGQPRPSAVSTTLSIRPTGPHT